MLIVATIPLTCWLCAFIAIPRRPRIGNEVEELVYARLLGGHQRLVLLALIVSAIAFFTLLIRTSHTIETTAYSVDVSQGICADAGEVAHTCYVKQSDGTRGPEQGQPAGTGRSVTPPLDAPAVCDDEMRCLSHGQR